MMKRQMIAFAFLSPALLFGLIFFLLPIVVAFSLTFTNFQAFAPVRGVGLTNYIYLLTRDPFFVRTLGNTGTFALGALLLGIPLSLLVAYASSRSRFRGLWRSIYWLPMVTNVVAVAFVWKFVLADSTGLVNRTLDLFGLPGPGWLTDPRFAMLSVILVFVWMNLGKSMILFSVGIDSIDDSCFEAARIDGADTYRVFMRVAVPLLKPTILFVAITDLITCLSSFPLMLVLTEGGPAHSTTVTALYTYDMAFADLRLGRASAAAFILFALIFGMMLVQLHLFRQRWIETD